MQEVDINTLVDENNVLNKNIPNNTIIAGKIITLRIKYKYNQLDLSKVECDKIRYYGQEGECIKNHILPNLLKELDCWNNQLTLIPNLPNSLKILDFSYNQLISFTNVQLPNSLEQLSCHNNQLSSLPDLPNSLKKIYCENNQLISLPKLPNSLKNFDCSGNNLTSLPKLPNSLKKLYCYRNKLTSFADAQLPNLLEQLYCSRNQLTSLPDLPNSLKILYCDYNQLTSLPDFTHIGHEIELSFLQDEPIEYIPYNKNIQLCDEEDNKIIIEGYPNNPITNQQELDQYMDYI